jgi:hypothetical protein
MEAATGSQKGCKFRFTRQSHEDRWENIRLYLVIQRAIEDLPASQISAATEFKTTGTDPSDRKSNAA